ncbi:fatty acyl-AMP ligase [Bradyrhizobium sp. Bra64]|uniref:fatty acyl-AMP ligase n=1 Tax=Bradyrhizobium sp. Bra64 TaxID=2926009 RepID=UPI002117B293|nr:fatty acyl-AMP ligase [Bradyrhizobium sp. Bra64]
MESFRSLVALLARRAEEQGDDRAYVFVSDRGTEEAVLTFRQLHHSACMLAARLIAIARRGERAVLVFPPGIEFMVAFFGCLVAGIIAVPMMMPRRNGARDASAAILANCTPAVALTTSAVALRGDLQARFAQENIRWIEVGPSAADAETVALPEPAQDDVALLQYTSGSTSEPKGVMVSHANLLANLEMIRLALGNTSRSTYVNWVPLYHDMGLILNALQALYVGATCVLMAPNAFMQRPLGWLRAISHYRAEVACSPNFGFDLCVGRYRADQMEGVDLSSLKIALNGAEPVRSQTIERFIATFAPHGFDPRAMYPAYGMAEATLLISGGRRGGGHVTRPVSRAALQEHAMEEPSDAGDTQIAVGCGRALTGERIAIVDADKCTRLPADRVGEIWVNGANIARAYWRNAEATRAGLNAEIAGEGGPWLRTGDLGFVDVTGELFVTGRIKDLLIIRGINHYPQDIERTVQSLDGPLRENCGAAFSVPDESGEETLVIVQEVERTARHTIDTEEIKGRIREAVADNHEISARHIALIRPGALPKTTSGKIQRKLARKLWLEGGFEQLA